jgi:hypothetical protein
MRVLLKTQMEELQKRKKAIDDAVINSYYAVKDKPTDFWGISGIRSPKEHIIDKVDINGFKVSGKREPFFYSDTRVTKKLVAEYEEFLGQYNPDESAICFNYHYIEYWNDGSGRTSRCSGSALLTDIIKGQRYSFDKSVMEKRQEEYIEKYGKKEGHEPCAYCGIQRKPEDLITGTIIGQNWRNSGYRSPPRKYCKDDGCRGYDQMAHEG